MKIQDIVPVFLTLRNDEFGETVSIGVEERRLDNTLEKKPFGEIARGQTYTLHLREIISVYAEQNDGLLTTITCEIHGR